MGAREASAESAAESVESTTLEALPDDAMLAVLSYLSPAQLLEARTVCRRWRRLALHPHLWRQRRLVDSFHGPDFPWALPDPMVRAVLLLAPCAASLCLEPALDSLGAAVVSTACAVAELFVSLKSNSDAVLATLAIRNQVSLGRLRKLSLSMDDAASCPAIVGLLAELHRTEGLTSLSVKWGWKAVALPGWASSAVPAEPTAASLESLVYQSTELFPHAAFLLRSHAATLTEVSLLAMHWPLGPLAELLAEARGLRSLKCPLLEDMRPLLQCRKLRKLELYPARSSVGSAEAGDAALYSPAAVEHAKAYFRKATHLRQLTFSEWQDSSIGRQIAASLVGALASSGHAKLRTLALADEPCDIFQNDQPYTVDDFRAMNLPGLPALWEILFELPDEDGTGQLSVALFEVLATQSVPSLHVVDGYPQYCLHQVLHEPVLEAALRRNPRLHVATANLGCYNGECVACNEQNDCGHDLDSNGVPEGCCICSHPEADDAKCRVYTHTRAYYGIWIRVDQEQA